MAGPHIEAQLNAMEAGLTARIAAMEATQAKQIDTLRCLVGAGFALLGVLLTTLQLLD